MASVTSTVTITPTLAMPTMTTTELFEKYHCGEIQTKNLCFCTKLNINFAQNFDKFITCITAKQPAYLEIGCQFVRRLSYGRNEMILPTGLIKCMEVKIVLYTTDTTADVDIEYCDHSLFAADYTQYMITCDCKFFQNKYRISSNMVGVIRSENFTLEQHAVGDMKLLEVVWDDVWNNRATLQFVTSLENVRKVYGSIDDFDGILDSIFLKPLYYDIAHGLVHYGAWVPRNVLLHNILTEYNDEFYEVTVNNKPFTQLCPVSNYIDVDASSDRDIYSNSDTVYIEFECEPIPDRCFNYAKVYLITPTKKVT